MEEAAGGMRHAHYLRKSAHILFGLPALLVKFIPSPWQVYCAGLLAVIAWQLKPHWPLLARMSRPAELRDGVMWGVRYYFGTLFIVSLLFPFSPKLLVATWLVLALADGLSAIVGGPLSPPVPWNRGKRLYGMFACFLGASAGLVFTRLWFEMGVGWLDVYQALAIGAAVAVVESLDTPLDDNLLVGLLTAALVWILGFITGVPIWG